MEHRGQHVSFLSKFAQQQEGGNARLRTQFQNIAEGGESRDRWAELFGRYSTRFLSLALFMVPANIAVGYRQFHREGLDMWLLLIFLVLFDVILLSYAIGIIRMILERIRDGNPRMHFQDKLVRRGTILEAAFYGSRKLKNRKTIHAYLRCIEERFVRSGRRQHLVCFERFKSTKQTAFVNSEGVAGFRFAVPAGAQASNFAGVLPTYWEVVVTYEAIGPNYEGAFLAPVEAVEKPVSQPGSRKE